MDWPEILLSASAMKMMSYWFDVGIICFEHHLNQESLLKYNSLSRSQTDNRSKYTTLGRKTLLSSWGFFFVFIQKRIVQSHSWSELDCRRRLRSVVCDATTLLDYKRFSAFYGLARCCLTCVGGEDARNAFIYAIRAVSEFLVNFPKRLWIQHEIVFVLGLAHERHTVRHILHDLFRAIKIE